MKHKLLKESGNYQDAPNSVYWTVHNIWCIFFYSTVKISLISLAYLYISLSLSSFVDLRILMFFKICSMIEKQDINKDNFQAENYILHDNNMWLLSN